MMYIVVPSIPSFGLWKECHLLIPVNYASLDIMISIQFLSCSFQSDCKIIFG